MIRTTVLTLVCISVLSAALEAALPESASGRFAKWILQIVKLAAIVVPITELIS